MYSIAYAFIRHTSMCLHYLYCMHSWIVRPTRRAEISLQPCRATRMAAAQRTRSAGGGAAAALRSTSRAA